MASRWSEYEGSHQQQTYYPPSSHTRAPSQSGPGAGPYRRGTGSAAAGPSTSPGMAYDDSRESISSADVPMPTEKLPTSNQNYSPSAWLQGERSAKSNSKRMTVIALLVLVALIAGGVTAGVVIHNRDSSGGSNKTSSGGSSSSSSSSTYNPSDPSDFPKDSRLHQSFWGFSYTPENAQLPWCGANQSAVNQDIQVLSQLTTRLHMYGADCNQSSLVLEAIKQTKVNMTVWLAIYIESSTNDTDYTRQLAETVTALQAYGADNVGGVIVGNEFILDSDPNNDDPSADTAAIQFLGTKMTDTRNTLSGLNLGKTIPVGTCDAGSKITATLANECDFVMANVHPYFGGVAIDQAAAWTYNYFDNNDVAAVNKSTSTPKPPVYIGETGWPTASMNGTGDHDGGAYPGVTELQTFLDTFVCQSNVNGTEYFYFEAFDEPWKQEFGGVEPYWGLFDQYRNLKNITIPNCNA